MIDRKSDEFWRSIGALMSEHPVRFRWAILGTGGVSRKFAADLRTLPGHDIVAVASRSPENADRFARETGAEAMDYERAAACRDADAVYVATPPSLHEVHACAAIAAGKAVLVEKPFAFDAEAAARIRDAARSAGVFCMEAMWTRFLPLMDRLREEIAAGRLGPLRGFVGGFTDNALPDPADSLFDPARGGGALMHRGLYPVSLARHFMGPVVETRAMARLGPTGVDEDVTLSLRHESGAVSTVTAGLRAAGLNRATLHGEAATVEIAPPIYRPFAARVLSMTPRVGGTGGSGAQGGRLSRLKETGLAQGANQWLTPLKDALRPPGRGIAARYRGNGYGHEAQAVATAVAAGQTEHPLMPLDESVEIMAIIDAARAQWA